MENITDIKVIDEFTNNGITYGVYSVIFKGDHKVFIRNGNSIGVVCYYFEKPASQCVSEIKDDVKKEFLSLLI